MTKKEDAKLIEQCVAPLREYAKSHRDDFYRVLLLVIKEMLKI